jgi:hypothetical protein
MLNNCKPYTLLYLATIALGACSSSPIIEENTQALPPSRNSIEPQNRPLNTDIEITEDDASSKVDNVFNTVSFPQDSCGDSPPEAGSVESNYAVFFYPVYVGYSGENLEKMQSQFCRDAFKTEREENGEMAIQVGSFLTEEKAEEFQRFLSRNFNRVEVGNPKFFIGQDSLPKRACRDRFEADSKDSQVFNVLINVSQLRKQGINIFDYCRSLKPRLEKDLVAQFTSLDRAKEFSSLFQQDDVDIEIQEELIKVQNENQQEVAQASQLEPDQVEALLEVDKNNPRSFEFKIVVPTYIPDGFQLVSLDLDNGQGVGDPSYELLYRHRDGRCFSLKAISGGLGAGAADGEIIQADSLILGQVNIILLKHDRIPGDLIMMWPTPSKILGAQYYQFTSGRECKQVISLAESKKIVESLRYLNPD